MAMIPSPLRIALLTYSTKPRGSVIHSCELAIALTQLGHQVCLYASDKDGLGFERDFPFQVRLVPGASAPESIDQLIQLRIQEFVAAIASDSFDFDIFHAQDCIGANALAQLKAEGTIPHFVRTVHHIEDYASPYLQQCQDKSIRQPDLCLCVSDRWHKVLQTDYEIVAYKVFNGVNLDRFSSIASGQEAMLKARYGISGSPVFLTVGGIEPRKNSIRLIEAFAEILPVYPSAQLVIAGGATLFDYQAYRQDFFDRVKALDLCVGQSLLLPGVIADDQLPILYRCADSFCFPSLKEGWGLVVLEAIASGLSVLVPHEPPFTEFLTDAWVEWVESNSKDSIHAGLFRLSLLQRSSCVVEERQTFLEKYSWQNSAQQHLNAYQLLRNPK